MVALAAVAPSLEFEETLYAQGYRAVAGVDEVGRGSLAGPVVAAAVILPQGGGVSALLSDVRDSKQLSAETREALSELVMQVAVAVGIGWASHHIVDSAGIASANRRALARAVRRLSVRADALLVDHFRIQGLDLTQVPITKGDQLSLSIASASIVAKVMRDRWMCKSDSRFPGYGFAKHKGYCTREHLRALEALGPCALHRKSFGPVAAWSI